MRFENFVGGTYQSWSPNADAERAINLMPELIESKGGKSRIALYGTPGLTTWTTLPFGPVRALWAGEDRLFGVGGSWYYEIFSDGSFTARHDVGDDAGHTPVQIWPNGVQLLVVSADKAYIDRGDDGVIQPSMINGQGAVNVDATGLNVTWVSGDKFEPSLVGNTIYFGASGTPYTVASFTDDTHLVLTTAVTGAPLANAEYTAWKLVTARTGTFLDGYYIVNPPDSKQFFFSDLYNGMVWDPLEISTKEGYPDNISSVYSDHEELWLFGSHWSTEVWRNEGDPNSAGGFRRDPGAFIHMACPAPWSICSLGSGLHFLGADTRGRTIAFRAQGFQPVRVSTHAVEQVWGTYSTVRDAYAYAEIIRGHQCWVIYFQTANATWVYDIATELWHERAWWNGTALEAHRGRCHAFVFGKHLVGDRTSGKIYEMRDDIYTDDGTPIHRVRQAPYVGNEESKIFHHQFRLELQVNGTAPSVALDWSDDDAATFVAPRTRAPQAVTRTRASVPFRRLGHAYSRIYRTTITDAVKVGITDAFLEASPGSS